MNIKISKIRLVWLMLICCAVSVQTAFASAKAGEATVYTGNTATISLAATYQNTLRRATGVTYRWYSENTSLVSVTGSTRDYATIKGISPTSSCRVYFYCSYFIDGFYRTMDFYYTITVKSSTVSVTSVSLNTSSASLTEGETLQLNASVYPTNATNRNVTWSSSNTSVATVTSNGLVTAKSAGTATITCRAADGSGKSATCAVTVEAEQLPTDITLNHTTAILEEGETLQLTAEIRPVEASGQVVVWMSDDTAIATVSADGLVTAVSEGEANIIATTSNHLAAVCQIRVIAHETGVQTDWAGTYTVSSRHVTADPSRDYEDDFEMTISRSDDGFIMTSLFGEDLTKYNDGGFRLKDLGNGQALIDVSYYNILRYTDNDSPLYALYIWDEAADDWSDEWLLTMNGDGTISVSDFYVVAFRWDDNEEVWKNGRVETLYYDLTARSSATGVETVSSEPFNYRIESGTVLFPVLAEVSLYRLDGMKVYSGTTTRIEGLSKGIYIMHTGRQSCKIRID